MKVRGRPSRNRTPKQPPKPVAAASTKRQPPKPAAKAKAKVNPKALAPASRQLLGQLSKAQMRAAWLELQKKFGEEDAGSDDELAGLEGGGGGGLEPAPARSTAAHACLGQPPARGQPAMGRGSRVPRPNTCTQKLYSKYGRMLCLELVVCRPQVTPSSCMALQRLGPASIRIDLPSEPLGASIQGHTTRSSTLRDETILRIGSKRSPAVSFHQRKGSWHILGPGPGVDPLVDESSRLV